MYVNSSVLRSSPLLLTSFGKYATCGLVLSMRVTTCRHGNQCTCLFQIGYLSFIDK